HRRQVQDLEMKAVLLRPSGIDLCAHSRQFLKCFFSAISRWSRTFSRCVQFLSDDLLRLVKQADSHILGVPVLLPSVRRAAWVRREICHLFQKLPEIGN